MKHESSLFLYHKRDYIPYIPSNNNNNNELEMHMKENSEK